MSELNHNQSPVMAFLEKSHAEDRLVHAYLFFGGSKDEKVSVAKKFAKLVLGADEITNRLIDSGEHANVITIKPDGKYIKKEQIVFLKIEIAKKSVENRSKIYIIEEADKMSLSATNSLLKFLEEPAPDVHIILISPSKEVLLPTIVSRTVNLGFRTLFQENVEIKGELLAVIQQLEAGANPHIVAVKHAAIVKEQTVAFLDAYLIYVRGMLGELLGAGDGSITDMKRCTKKLRAIEEAKRSLQYQMNVQLCLDKLWIDFSCI